MLNTFIDTDTNELVIIGDAEGLYSLKGALESKLKLKDNLRISMPLDNTETKLRLELKEE